MYEYVDGKVDWMAYGLPVEGEDGPFLSDQLTEVPTCDVGGTVGDARKVLAGSGGEDVVVVGEDGLVIGDVDFDALEGVADDVELLEVLRPVPSTVRPSVTVSSLAEAGGGRRLVTTSDGRLLGQVKVEGAQGAGHEGHDHGEASIDVDRYEDELATVMKAVEERFQDRQPSEDELRAFLRDHLIGEGRSEEEADQLLGEMGKGAD